jgi:hypothetical protein
MGRNYYIAIVFCFALLVCSDGTGPDSGGETYTIVAAAQGDGTIALSPNKPAHNSGETVTASATPGIGSSFIGWSGDLSSFSNPKSFLVSSNMAITANFIIEAAKYTLTISSLNGSISLNPSQSKYNSGQLVQATAIPNSGFYFSSWGGALYEGIYGTNQNPKLFFVSGDMVISANFPIQ